jgi:hypothetical protein
MDNLARKICHAVEQRSDDVNVEMMARVSGVLTNIIGAAVNASCNCGGKPLGEGCCPACEVWHRIHR